MRTQSTTVGNGLRVVTHNMPHVETVSLGVWVATGARHEGEAENGISHLLEHMAFKGTSRRTAQRIAEEIEDVGGDLNAATSLETTAYYARVLREDVGVALDILADILQGSTFDEGELEREREVILQEIMASQDSPDDLVYDLVQEAAYPGQPLGRTILGTAETVKSITAADLKAHLSRHYAGGRMVVSAAGAVDHEMIARACETLFSGLGASTPVDEPAARYAGGVRASNRSFEQSHLVVGFEGAHYHDPDFFAMLVLSRLFGGGMSSRLFQEVREKRGLCYDIYSSAWGLSDTGMISVHAATGAELMEELVEVIGSELDRLVSEGPTAAEVQRAKAQLKVGLMSGLESPSARAEQMARHLLMHGRIIPQQEILARVEAVDIAALTQLTRTIAGRRPSAAVVGAGGRSKDFARQAGERFAAAVA